MRSKTFWEIIEVSFFNAKVHFSWLGDFEIDGFEEIEWDGMIVEVIGVNTLTDWSVVGNSEIGADKKNY